MGVIVTKSQSVDRQSLTFKILGTGSVAFVNAIKKNIVDNVFDPTGIETEDSAGAKLAFILKTITAIKNDLLCLIEENTYEVVCHAYSFDAPFTAVEGTYSPIPYKTILYNPCDGSFSDGIFSVGKAGYYDVSAYFLNPLVVAPVGTNLAMMIGSTYDMAQVDYLIMNTDRTQLQGSRTVYCPSGGAIYAALSHNYAGDIVFNSVAYPGAGGYISISYSASNKAATLV